MRVLGVVRKHGPVGEGGLPLGYKVGDRRIGNLGDLESMIAIGDWVIG